MSNKRFISDLQRFTAISAVGVSALRGQGKHVLGRVRKHLGKMDLAETFALRRAEQFSAWLNSQTEDLMLSGKAKWGAARKALNLFLRDCLYNKYLCAHYRLERLELWMEIPLDSVIAGQLKRDAGRGRLPRWLGLKQLKKDDSLLFQKHASQMATQRNTARVHLDVDLWVNGTQA